jgi:L-fuculose-phosphate aldolase
MKARSDVRACIHTHPPHATAFAVAHEPIPKCILPEFEVFLGEVAIAPYETPGTQAFADTILPYVKDTDTIILANHGTITYGSDLQDAYFKTEIIDAYCRILILSKQLGTINYYSDEKAAELIRIKPGLGIPDPRLARGLENCDLCGNSLFREGYSDFKPEPKAFIPPKLQKQYEETAHACTCPTANGQTAASASTSTGASTVTIPGDGDVELLVKMITDQVMSVLSGQNTSVVPSGPYASGLSGGI